MVKKMNNVIWYLALVAIGIAAFGSLLLIKTLRKIFGSFRRDMLILFIAASFAILSSLLVAILGLNGIVLENALWNIPMITFSLSTILFAVSMFDLNKTLGNLTIEMSGSKIRYRASRD